MLRCDLGNSVKLEEYFQVNFDINDEKKTFGRVGGKGEGSYT